MRTGHGQRNDGSNDSGDGKTHKGPAITRVVRTMFFCRLLKKHSRRPGRPAEAASKAERILDALETGAGLCPWEAGSLTRWGDARVPECVKFILSGGYRLICRRRGGTLLALFLGNHEECHNWLRGRPDLEEVPGEIQVPPATSGRPADHVNVLVSEPLSILAEREYTDRELRTVFAGLCEK